MTDLKDVRSIVSLVKISFRTPENQSNFIKSKQVKQAYNKRPTDMDYQK